MTIFCSCNKHFFYFQFSIFIFLKKKNLLEKMSNKSKKRKTRNDILSENWICGVCNSIYGPTDKEIAIKFKGTLFVLCDCESLHAHPQCLPDSILKKGERMLSPEEIKFYCLQCLYRDSNLKSSIIPVDPTSFYSFEKSMLF